MAALMVLAAMPGVAQVPLVYDVEHTGTNFPAPPLPTMANLPVIQPLPDPFAWANDPFGGTRSTNFSDWSHRRAEVKAQIENYEIGYKPPVDPAMIFASISGSGTSRTLIVRVTNVVSGTNRTLSLTNAISLPGSSGIFPAIIGMNSPSGSISLGGRPIATITYLHNQVTTYGNQANSNPYYQLYAAPYSPALNNNNTGQYSAWAWGVSRIIDGLYKLNGDLGGGVQINLQRIGVTGCSYAGKMALFAGALDERIALTIPQESGGGGAPNWRYSATEPTGTVEGLAQTDHNWFSESMFTFGGANVSRLPEDHHLLMALVAPRALFATGNPDGAVWLSNPSCYVSCKAVERVYDTFGISDRFGYNIEGGKPHCATTASLNADIGAFLDKFLLGMTNLNTVTNRHVPVTYNTVNYSRWTSWWGTGSPIFPEIGLSIPASATEGNGTLIGLGRVNLNGIAGSNLVVSLISSNTSEVTVPDSVIIPAGQSNGLFDLTIVDDGLLDGDQTAIIRATSTFAANTPQATIRVYDNDPAILSVTLPSSVSESAGTLVGAGSISIGTAAGKNVPVSLSSSMPTALTVPSVTIIPAGQTSAVFNLTIVNDGVLEAPKNVSITAQVQNWTNGFASITIMDDDPPDHLALSPIPSPQVIGESFPVTITAENSANNTVDYQSPVALSALVPGDEPGTNTMLGSPGLNQSFPGDPDEYTWGYSFTPSANLKVTHVRHFFGDKVAIWTSYRRLLASQNVVSVPGIWVDTPLAAPVILSGGDSYVLTAHGKNVERFWSDSLPSTFPHGTVSQSYYDFGDKFPNLTTGERWFVDLRYATDIVSVPVNPTATGNLTNGTWSGNVAVLEAATNLILRASAGTGYSGSSAPFDVLATPKLAIATFSNSVVLSWPVGASGFSLERATTLSDWTNAPGTPTVVNNRYHVTNALDSTRIFFRLRKP